MADTLTEEKVTMFMDAFNSIADRNGVIRTRELGIVMKTLGENPTPEEVQNMINEVDKEGIGTVKFPSFLTMMASKDDSLVAEDEIREAFRVFDVVSSSIIIIIITSYTWNICKGWEWIHLQDRVEACHDEPGGEDDRGGV